MPQIPLHLLRNDLGAPMPAGAPCSLLKLLVMSDVQVVDTVSPARCEWVELLGDDPLWQPLLHMHRPYEALTHWALAAHVEAARRQRHDLALFLGDNIDNAQYNEWEAFLTILAGGRTSLDARGGVHEAGPEMGAGPWPFWCPEPGTDDTWKRRGYPAVPGFLQRASADVHSPGLGFPWACLPGNHDLMRQGTALPEAEIEAIATGSVKLLQRPAGFAPADPLSMYVQSPSAFSRGATRSVAPLASRAALDKRAWIAGHVRHGGAGYTDMHVRDACTDAVVDTEHARILLLDTNHPAGDYQGSIGAQQLAWLDAQLSEVDAQPGRVAILASHHGAVSLTNHLGNDPVRQHAAALLEVAHRHPSVVAWLVGHRHLHEVRAHPGPRGGFWEISTGAIIDWPVQARSIEFLRHANGTLEIVCTLQDHGAPEGSLAHLHHALARRFAGTHAARMQGAPEDGNLRLLRVASGTAA